MTGSQLATLAEEINGGASIASSAAPQYGQSALVEQRRRGWRVTTANTWQTAIDLSTITRFNRFDSDDPIQLFDGTNRVARFRQAPWNLRLHYKDVPHTFVYDEANKQLYLNGTVPVRGHPLHRPHQRRR
jgi:hypothetical protein